MTRKQLSALAARSLFAALAGGLALCIGLSGWSLAQTYLMRRPVQGLVSGSALADLTTGQATQLDEIHTAVTAAGAAGQCWWQPGSCPSGSSSKLAGYSNSCIYQNDGAGRMTQAHFYAGAAWSDTDCKNNWLNSSYVYVVAPKAANLCCVN